MNCTDQPAVAEVPIKDSLVTDGELLKRFAEHRDQQAFADLVGQHGPMVFGVCRRILRNHHDAEDAFQATFVVLARKASSIARPALLANWLYVVAHHVSTKAHAVVARRSVQVKPISDLPEPATVESESWIELAPVLDQELRRLAEKYRTPLILCDLEGLTRKEAARQLGWAEGTVSTRLMKARAVLEQRLTRQGYALPAGTLAVLLSQQSASAAVPSSLAASTIAAASAISAGQAVPTGVISAKATELSRQMLTTLLLGKIKVALGIMVVVTAAATGVSKVVWMKAPVVAVAADGIPANIRAALEQNANAINPIGIRYTTEIRSRLSQRETLEKLQIAADRVSPILFAKRPYRTIVEGQKFYSSGTEESLPPRSNRLIVASEEGSFDGAVLYGGRKYKRLGDSMGGDLRMYGWERQKKSHLSIPTHLRGPYFTGTPTYSGLSFSRKAGQQSELTAESDILRLLRMKGKVQSVENVSLDGRSLVKIELIVENQTRDEAEWIDLRQLEGDDSEELATPDERRRTAEILRWQRKLPATKRVVYFLDPALNYAVRRREDWYDPHTLLIRCDCSEFEKLSDHPVWLPHRCVSEIHELQTRLFYQWDHSRLLAPKRTYQFDDSFLTEIVEVTELTTTPFPAEQFVLKYTEPGIYIEDHTLPAGDNRQFGGIGYRTGQTPAETALNLARATEQQTNGKRAQRTRDESSQAAGGRGWTTWHWFVVANISVLFLVTVIAGVRRFVLRKD
ncbi:RNA polymerase sigma factor [Schlesneria paludicola]|uniref:RNA polymerase sigma factor n=1 Tax=Schlesneria paludicola TaxID=360056 RepID=UPI00030FE0E1|nr:RNA polymerase sigma factor [Schlesneria paludicola]